MTETLTYTEYRSLVEQQSRAMLDAITLVTKGNLNVELEIPDGVEGLSELSVALKALLMDFRALTNALQKTQQELEDRVEARNGELPKSRNQAQISHYRHIQNEWAAYTKDSPDLQVPPNLLSTITAAIREQKLVTDSATAGEANLALPIEFADELVGILGFSQGNASKWTEQDLADVKAIAEQVGIALENQRLSEQTKIALTETQDQAQRLAQLSDLGTRLSQTTNLSEALETIEQTISKVVNNDRASVVLVVNQQEYEVVSVVGAEGSIELGGRGLLRDSTIERALQAREIIVNNDLKSLSDYGDGVKYQRMGSNLCAPLIVGGQAIGTLNLGSKRAHAFTQRDRNLVTQLTTLLASTLENQRLLEQTQQRAQREQRLREVTARIRSSSDVETIMQIAVKEVGEALGRAAYLSISEPPTTENRHGNSV